MLGFIAAMPQEQKAITDQMTDVEVRTIAEAAFYKGHLADEEIVVALSGVGKVAAAIASTLLCENYHPDALLSIGVAGGLKEGQHVGELVFSDYAIQADYDTSAIDGKDGIGKVSTASRDLLERAEAAAKEAGLTYTTGSVATQDLFMAYEDDFKKLFSRFPQSACSEMEGGAIAQVASQFGLPFLIIRTLSDIVGHNDNPVEFSSFVESSSQAAGRFVKMFCTR